MNRFLLVAIVCGTIGVMSCSPSETSPDELDLRDPSLVWDVSLWGNPRAGTVALDTLAKLVEERTAGKWVMRLHYGEALSKARENLDGIAIGAFEAAMVCNFYHPQKTPALMILTLPFLPMDSESDSRAIRKAVYEHPAVVAELARWNAMIYTSTFLPQYELMGRGEPPLEIEDFKGMTVRAGGGLGQALRLLGVTPTSAAAPEVYTGVQQGTMDAATFPYTYGHVAYRIHEVSDWYTSNLAPGTADCPIVFARNAYDALPAEYRTLLEEIESAVEESQLKAYQDADAVNTPLLRESLTEVTYDVETRERLRDTVGKQIIEEWIEENQSDFDARGLVKLAFDAVGQTYD